jgi:hypothetical protein
MGHGTHQHEDDPTVGPTGSLSNLVSLSLLDELRHDLLDELTKDRKELHDLQGSVSSRGAAIKEKSASAHHEDTKGEGTQSKKDQSLLSSGKKFSDLRKNTRQKSWFWRPWRLVPALKKLNPIKRGWKVSYVRSSVKESLCRGDKDLLRVCIERSWRRCTWDFSKAAGRLAWKPDAVSKSVMRKSSTPMGRVD